MRCLPSLLLLFTMPFAVAAAPAPPQPLVSGPSPVILDTDIGDDIDDAYALALLLRSPEVKVLGVTTAFGDTTLRARLAARFLQETGHQAIPVLAGPPTPPRTRFSQEEWAKAFPARKFPDAIAFMRDTIRKHPGQVTLISIAPLTNVGALIRQDPATFRKLKRVVIMGGSIRRGYGEGGHTGPDAEWNIQCDIPSAQALFASGVPLYVMPLDSTMISLDLARRHAIFDRKTPLTNALQELTQQWRGATQHDSPTLFDAVAAAYAVEPNLCPMTSMRIEVDDKGFTREVDGAPNAHVCLSSDSSSFYDFVMPRLLQ